MNHGHLNEIKRSGVKQIVSEADELIRSIGIALDDTHQSNKSISAISSLWALSDFDDVKANQAFLSGAKMLDGYEVRYNEAAAIFKNGLENSFEQSPPNELILPSQTIT